MGGLAVEKTCRSPSLLYLLYRRLYYDCMGYCTEQRAKVVAKATQKPLVTPSMRLKRDVKPCLNRVIIFANGYDRRRIIDKTI